VEKVKAVIFDIDGTISPGVSWTKMTEALGGSVENHKKIYKAFLDGKISYQQTRMDITQLWMKTGNATRANLEKIFVSWPVFPEAKELISFLQNKNIPIAFITGSKDLFADITAKKFSVSEYYASGELVFDDNGNLVDFYYPLDSSKKKLELFLEFCKKFSLDPKTVVALGDSDNDVGIFTKTQRGIMIGNKPESLARVAWRQVDNISEASNLIRSLV
jgi:HAD superfamily phosphoserine phosphatase-like hydrolase